MLKKINYAYVLFTLFIFFIIYSFSFILNTNDNTKNNYLAIEKIELLTLLDKNFDTVLEQKLQYIKYPKIKKDIATFDKELQYLHKILLKHIKAKKLSLYCANVKETFIQKQEVVKEFKKYNELLVNSIQKLLKLQSHIQKRYYFSPISLEVNALIVSFTQSALGKKEYIQYISQHLKKLTKLNKVNSLADEQLNTFINNSHLTLKYLNKLNHIVKIKQTIHLSKSLEDLKNFLISYFEDSYQKEKIFSYILLFTIIIFLFVLIITYEIDKKHKGELVRFKQAVENSDNSVVITDINKNITYVNEAFEKNTGYSKEEVYGQNPRVLKSGIVTSNQYQELNDHLAQKESWEGEFVNKKKNGEIFYEKASIVPIIMDGELNGYMAIKLDITDYINQTNQLLEQIENSKKLELENKKKEEIMFQQSKMASMGEMFENIAHQWRQPLSVISTSASGIQVQKEYGMLTDEILDDLINKIIETTEHMSSTINDFRNFFKKNTKKETLNLKESLEKTLSLLSSKFKNKNIQIIKDMKDLQILGLNGELIQSFMNIFSNAQDALLECNEDARLIFINIFQEEEFIILEIQDTGGGIPKDIIQHIFEPYFTTKHKSHGTGIGLYMTYEIIVKHHDGIIDVQNHNFTYNDKKYTGAKFTIKFPKITT